MVRAAEIISAAAAPLNRRCFVRELDFMVRRLQNINGTVLPDHATFAVDSQQIHAGSIE
jgi:hypothetical protein